MSRTRKSIAVVLVALAAALPMPGCTNQQGASAFCNSLVQLALGVGVSVGSYFLIKEISG